ncbi:Endonuclease/exonuclease/phosphatase [Phakopsora pachyrhizi]|nr:Endonuclease/exonuclease/phosphatase [Phakopsora pachyrhizi]
MRFILPFTEDRQLQRDDLMGPWLDRYTSRKKTFGIGSESIEDKTLSAQDQLSKLLSSPPVSPSPTATTSPTIIVPKPLSIAPDLPEWRQNWLNERLRELEDEYVTSEKIKVRVGTWNVYGKQPTESLQEWLMPEEERDDGADIYVICLQEIDDTSEAYIRYTPFRENHWCEVVHKTLESRHENQRVIKVANQQLIGLLIVVYIKESLFKDVSDVSTSYLGTGTLGMGNKGATAVRLRFCDTYLTFINSHLAAFQEQYEARNRDYFEICRRLSFPTIDRRKFQLDSIPKLKFLGSGPTSPSPTCDIFQTG